jgi:tRNA A37 methylthiotransferase MiaB
MLEESSKKFAEAFLGQELSVLWEQVLKSENGVVTLSGLTDNYLRVEAIGPEKLWNRFSQVRIDRLDSGGVLGTIMDLPGEEKKPDRRKNE